MDTSVIVAAAYPDTPSGPVAVQLCADLQSSRANVYVSEIVRLEFGRVIRRLATKPNQLTPETRDAFGLDRWTSQSLVRQRWLSNGVRRLTFLFENFHSLTEIPMSNPIWRESIRIMGFESLDAADAVHIATAREIGIDDFFTLDADFRNVLTPRIHLFRDPRSQE